MLQCLFHSYSSPKRLISSSNPECLRHFIYTYIYIITINIIIINYFYYHYSYHYYHYHYCHYCHYYYYFYYTSYIYITCLQPGKPTCFLLSIPQNLPKKIRINQINPKSYVPLSSRYTPISTWSTFLHRPSCTQQVHCASRTLIGGLTIWAEPQCSLPSLAFAAVL